MEMNNWHKAKQALHESEEWLALIGKPQRTSRDGIGSLHSLGVKTVIHHQETDGAKNYHECKAFDRVFSAVVANRFDELRDEALAMLRAEVKRTGIEARSYVKRMLDQIDQYEP